MISNDMNLNMIFNILIKIDRDLQILMSLKKTLILKIFLYLTKNVMTLDEKYILLNL